MTIGFFVLWFTQCPQVRTVYGEISDRSVSVEFAIGQMANKTAAARGIIGATFSLNRIEAPGSVYRPYP